MPPFSPRRRCLRPPENSRTGIGASLQSGYALLAQRPDPGIWTINPAELSPIKSETVFKQTRPPLLSETQPFIQALIKSGLTVQAFHQHLPDMSPMFWFVHFRGEGAPKELAQAAHNAVKVTSIQLPQHPPAKPPTPFDKSKLEKIVGGHAMVGSNGVVTVSVDRAEQIRLGGVSIHPGLGVAATIAFQPLNSAGTEALAIPDFAMIASEVDGVFKVMQAHGFYVGCLYNQETDEQPQLYFAHIWANGDVYDLASKIRHGLNKTNSKFQS